MRRTIDILNEDMSSCLSCELWKNRTKFIKGLYNDHDPRRRLAFINVELRERDVFHERPMSGRDLDVLLSFTGYRNLDSLFLNAALLTSIKCPTSNNTPLEVCEGLYHCKQFLIRQLELIQPTFVMTFDKRTYHALTSDIKPNTALKFSDKYKQIPDGIQKINIAGRKMRIFPNLPLGSFHKNTPKGSKDEFARRFNSFMKSFREKKWRY